MSRGVLFNSESARRHAESCIQLARQALTSPDKTRWLEMAQYWFGKSEQLRRQEAASQSGIGTVYLDSAS